MVTYDVDETILALTGSGQADTRPAIVKQTSLAPSTVSAAVSRLAETGVIMEAGHSVSTGRRRTHHPVTSDGVETFVFVELGVHHGLITPTDPTRGVGQALNPPISIAKGSQTVLDAVMDKASRQEEAAGVRVGGIALAVPGPVDTERSRAIRPARMSGQNGASIAKAVAEQCDLPVPIENDARVGAIGESVYRRRLQGVTLIDTFIYVRVGSAIGGAYLIDGMPQVGQDGLAGDISHTPVEATAGRSCKCDNVGCFETIASADSIRVDLIATGLVYGNNVQLPATARDGIPEATTAIRQAGTLLDRRVAHLVSFLASQGIIASGVLSAVDTSTAGVRAALHQSRLLSIMEHLVAGLSRSECEAAFWGLPAPTSSKISKENRS